MTTARFFFGASLWTLLIVHMCCGPVKKGFHPRASFSSSSMYPRSGSNQGAPSSQFSPEGAYSEEPEPAASAGSGSSTKPVQSGGSAARENPASPAQSGAGFQSVPQESKWLIAPPNFGDEETPEVDSVSEEFVRLPLPPVYQAGELSHYEREVEGGQFESENEEHGFLPPPRSEPKSAFVGPPPPPLEEFLDVSPPRPDSGRRISYPYYDYRFLYGQYPIGTYSYYSGSQERGNDNFREDHYVRENSPPQSPLLLMDTPTVEAPKAPAKGGSGHGGAAVRSIQSRRTAKKPLLHARGYGSNSNAVKHG